MAEAARAAVLHITTAAGGGVDRYIRDLACATPRRHYVLHVGPGVDVVEDVRSRQFFPLRRALGSGPDDTAMTHWLAAAGIGVVHLHSIDEACRARLEALLRFRALPHIVTLHDLLFANPRAFDVEGTPEVDAAWVEKLRPTLLGAKTVTAASRFIADIASRSNPGIVIALIEPGIATQTPGEVPLAPPEFVAQAPRHVVATVGALGPHKGSAMLAALGEALEGTDIGIVVIGYTDTELDRGWLVPGRLYIHGPYIDHSLAGWLQAYGAQVALFPNRLPESFSYTLSEVWACGVPAIVPDEGALGERVARHGGGWRLRAGFDGTEAAAFLVRLFADHNDNRSGASPSSARRDAGTDRADSDGAAEHARVKSALASHDAFRIPTLEAMARDVDALYERFGEQGAEGTDDEAARAALAPLLAANLDGFVFRKELVKLTGEVAEAKSRLAEAQLWTEKLERDLAQTAANAEAEIRTAKAWASKVESDAVAWTRKLEGDIAALKGKVEVLRAAFDRIPRFVRKFLLK